jgi:hypothetical protein
VLLVCTVYSVLYCEIAVSRKSFGIGHTCIYTILLRMTDTMISQNIDLSSCDTLQILLWFMFVVLLKRSYECGV